MAALAVLLSACANPFSKGLDVCQEDECFVRLAEDALKKGDREGARQFCQAVLDASLQEQCLNTLKY